MLDANGEWEGKPTTVRTPSIEVWAYGETRACPESCIGKPRGLMVDGVIRQCPTCHGTGEVRGPGLVENVLRDARLSPDGSTGREVARAIRKNLGTP